MTDLAIEERAEGSAMSALSEDSQDLLAMTRETDPDMREAEEALQILRQRFQDTEDPQAQGELAAEALDYVERQLALARERRRALDGVEGKLWGRRNRLEQFLIHTRGITWWHARRSRRSVHRGT
jgi:hypothetical protein